jgi:hypothetical protein
MATVETMAGAGQDIRCWALDGEVVILNVKDGNNHSLDKVGARTWALRAGCKSQPIGGRQGLTGGYAPPATVSADR